jgi:long-chain acyl-CoA synthetase
MNTSLLLRNTARAFGDRPAISLGEETCFTYAELHERVSKLAGGLTELKRLKPGDRVVVAMSNRPIYLEVLFAIWQAGMVAVPVNAKLHPREIAFIVENCGARLCFATEDHADAIATALENSAALVKDSVPVVCVDKKEYNQLMYLPAHAAEAAGDELAWIFYTSGTTGRPKGAMLTHQNLQLMAWSYLCDIDLVTPADSLLHLGPQSHAAGLLALTHVAKASNHVLPVSGGVDAAEIASLIDRYDNLTFFAAPTMLRRMLESDAMASCNIDHVRTIIGGGAPFYASDVRRALQAYGPRFTNGYGQGECPCTITSMPKHLYSPEMSDEELVSVGLGRSGVEVRVVDTDGRELPTGNVGEIVVRSPIVMRGYWDNPDATASAIKDGWLHTGDLGAMDRRGLLTLKDRSKDLIISGGSNIYPREVEDVLLTHEGVAEVAVVGQPDAEWGESVVAFVVSIGGAPPPTDQLDRLCLESLARYKRPKRYVFVDSLPRNNTGKVLKNDLRALAVDPARRQRGN